MKDDRHEGMIQVSDWKVVIANEVHLLANPSTASLLDK